MIDKIKRVIRNPFILISFLICKLRSLYFSRFIDEGSGKIVITSPFIDFKIVKGRNAKIIVNGLLKISPHLEGTAPVRIILRKNSTLKIDGDFIIGHGVKLYVGKNGLLSIGGRKLETRSGITSDSMIMVKKKIVIGVDFLCSWGVFISDSDWHQIVNQKPQADVLIGDHVWVASNSSILKGTIIGHDCIIASQSKLLGKEYPSHSLIGGLPAKLVKSGVSWSRDIKMTD